LSLSTQIEGEGTISRSPEGISFSPGTQVTLTATPASASQFQGWAGDVPAGEEMSNPLVITLDANKSLVARFVRVQHPLTVLATNGVVLKAPINPL
jgi:hypothetical protein